MGVSNLTGPEFEKLAAALGETPLAANQVSYHLFDRRWERSSFEACRSLGAGIMGYGSLAHGLLTGTITRSTTFDTSDCQASGVFFGQPLLTAEHLERNLNIIDRLAEFATGAGMRLPQLALS